MIEVYKTKDIGFCFGVKRAINMVLKEAQTGQKNIYTIGPIIHNPQMVDMLREKGIRPVDDIKDIEDGTVVFRTHGIKKEDEEYIKQRGLRYIDATCPFVKKVRRYAIMLKKMGYKVVIVGEGRHPEVKSVLSYLDNDGIVLQKPDSIDARKIGVVSQTTLEKDFFLDIVTGLLRDAEELRVYNTICVSTSKRKQEASRLAEKVDMMLIVGGKNSSNTTKLYEMVKRLQPKTYHIETEDDLDPVWFSGVKRVGITGGASTPDFIIDKVERQVKNF
ncbi:MAG TPA: 4-hydroxy-3-methylbut-2-enyl diphosphate reductase [Syntrophorhabdaceae bacterium]|nr:4-hydroxy-3-methylbut-2-enyl diphosphate reductase [Syntrophorhabdaceae bacterium]HPC66998.1 4-hydroxy-3-methylbut-2-enyl diphosphate reductase [Syntrophorhabdaceae bacterium]HPP42425.1 4-hydroxy-3-methylbut-2-enyl diphosphate reductase [Syntrophorhabdaceae bacterium]HQE81038.1 4-hydroxy-3-methylbut-2-enyl diphosphate reductase [Syntrophorhabdaceae bacterium]HQH43665.1 4-hydroxy-3-methylbut-2-enyl diphosphate reductase [Syntrophorhabdaceae bacterium]